MFSPLDHQGSITFHHPETTIEEKLRKKKDE